jgi:hypothetical protein
MKKMRTGRTPKVFSAARRYRGACSPLPIFFSFTLCTALYL